jgi:DNA-binding LacI/PurR family transcriptional regulator/AraC-like DNA-binding protein
VRTLKKRKLFGVIAANAADTEQREILRGIIKKAQSMNIDIAVLSNIYNPAITDEIFKTENQIYTLIRSDEYDGIIILSESLFNPDVRRLVLEELQNKDLPMVAVGTELQDFPLPALQYINTCDETDIEDICDHLIYIHGFTDIHILTGFHDMPVSHKRVEGYRRSLEKHGIPFDENKVFFGDFWMISGHAHAKRYISGELPYPQALICCNDYMAYGLLDEFLECNIDINEKMSVIGYEYIRDRYRHVPLLTTFQRNRYALGIMAMELLTEKTGIKAHSFLSETPRGQIICGNTCPCKAKITDIRSDFKTAQHKNRYDFLDLFNQLELSLIECRNIAEFVKKIHEFNSLVRDADKLYMCLYENWYDTSPNSSNMVGYNLLHDEEPFVFHNQNISAVFRNDAAPYYFCPLFFSDRELGYVVLSFRGSDTFDHFFRNWLKTVANCLEFLRMKNDIKFYLQCQDISEEREPLTGMLNENGLRKVYRNADKSNLCLVALRIGTIRTYPYSASQNEQINSVLDAAEAVREFSGNHICGKINEDTFFCFMRDIPDIDVLTKQLSAVLLHHTAYMKINGLDSYVCAAVPCDDDDYMQVKAKCFAKMAEMTDMFSARRTKPHYQKLNKLRTQFYNDPQITFDSEDIYSRFNGSAGYLRTIFRKCYGFTLHDDCINARIAAARYYITMSNLSNAEIAEKCGYKDLKYFLRQFQQVSGYTVLKYRTMWSYTKQ